MVTMYVSAGLYLRRLFFIVARILFFVLFVRFFIFELSVVSGPSMRPTFNNGDRFLVFKSPYLFRAPRRFEVVKFIEPLQRNELLLKRVLALPGEYVVIKRNRVCVQAGENKEDCIIEEYLPQEMITNMGAGQNAGQYSSFILPQDNYYLLGDNRLQSRDSRHFGPVDRRLIIGRALPLQW